METSRGVIELRSTDYKRRGARSLRLLWRVGQGKQVKFCLLADATMVRRTVIALQVPGRSRVRQ